MSEPYGDVLLEGPRIGSQEPASDEDSHASLPELTTASTVSSFPRPDTPKGTQTADEMAARAMPARYRLWQQEWRDEDEAVEGVLEEIEMELQTRQQQRQRHWQQHWQQPPRYQPQQQQQQQEETNVSVGATENRISWSFEQWLQIFMAFLAVIVTFGFTNTVGLLQVHLLNGLLEGMPSWQVGWIFSLLVFLVFSVPVAAGWGYDRFGPRWITRIGSTLTVVGLVMAMFAQMMSKPDGVYGLLVVSLGICVGTGIGMVITAITGHLNDTFHKNSSGLAFGVVFMGGSVGGIVWSVVMRATLENWNWLWSIFTVALVAASVLLLYCCRNRLYSSKPKKRLDSDSNDPEDEELATLRARMKQRGCHSWLFRYGAFLLMTCSMAFFEFVTLSLLAIFPELVEKIGISRSKTFYMMTALNAGAAVGRVFFNWISDFLGPSTVATLTQFFSGVLVFIIGGLTVIYRDQNMEPLLYIFAMTWGFSAGSVMSMMAPLVGEMSVKKTFGLFYGINSFAVAIAGLVSIPMTSKLSEWCEPEEMFYTFGGLCLWSTLLMVLAKCTQYYTIPKRFRGSGFTGFLKPER